MNVHTHRLQLLYLVLGLLVVGHLMLFSATGVLAIQRHGDEFYFVLRQGLCALAGLLLMGLCYKFPPAAWDRVVYPLMAIQIILLALVLFSPLAIEVQGATRWLRVGGVRFQPSEFAKVTLGLFFAKALAELPLKLDRRWVPRGITMAVLVGLIYKQPDLGTTVLLTLMVLGMLFVAGLKIRYLAVALSAGTALFAISLAASEYRRRRFFAFLNPWDDPQGSGFQSIQSFLSLHSGEWLGEGIGNGNSKLFYLPEVHTDFIFSLVGEELGFVGAMGILLAFTYLGYLLFRISAAAPTLFGRYLAFGLALSLVLQVCVNLGGVTGLIPVKGLPLPFFSWGRSALLAHLVSLGILLNILKQSEIILPEAGGRKSRKRSS